MNLRFVVFVVCCLALLPAVGCAKKGMAKPGEPAKATLPGGKTAAVREQPVREPEPAEAPVARGSLINAVAAVVNDDIVTLYEVNREAQPLIREAEQKSRPDSATLSRLRHLALDRLIERKLVDQKIRELNIKVGEDEIRQAIEDVKRQSRIPSQDALVAALANEGVSFDQYRTQLQEQLERLKLISYEVKSKIQVSESEIREQYNANPDQYSEEERFRARHILIRLNDKASAEDIKRAMSTALSVLADARSGKDFIALVKAYSEDPAGRENGGDLGVFKKGDMLPELEQAILPMKPGEISELVFSPSGFHIIKLEERIKGKVKPFESVRAEIEDALYRKKSEERFSQWAKELRSKASVEIRELRGYL
jgi:peptidyl-prolyl cis-trans isomerase SurA